MKTNLTVIIPTLNNVKGLKYLLNYFKDKSYKVVVVDNKKKNIGFAGGVNKGARNVKTKWMLILNDDIEFKEENYSLDSRLRGNDIGKSKTIESLIKYAEGNNLDAVSPVLRNPDGKIENLGYRVLPIGKVELVKENYRLDPRRSLPSSFVGGGDDIMERGNDSASIDGLTAACLLVKTSVFKKLNGFDESFFAYLEDVDFFLRMKKLDPRLRGDDTVERGDDRLPFGIAYDIEVLHNHMITAKTMGNFKARQDMINWWRLFLKHKDRFKFDWQFVIERLRNVSGFIKASLK